MRKSKLVVAIGAATVALTIASGVALASGWRVVAQRSAGGDFAVTATDATVHRPQHIAVRMIGGSGDIVWACSRGFSIGSWSRSFGRGLHELQHVRGQDSCDVTASIGGSGHVTVQILTHQ